MKKKSKTDSRCSPRVIEVGGERIVVMTYGCYQQMVEGIEGILNHRRLKKMSLKDVGQRKNRIKEMRERKGITVGQLAKRLRATPGHVKSIERPSCSWLSFAALGRIAKALRCSVHELIG